MERNACRSYECASWEEFTCKVRPTTFIQGRIFRGHADVNWKLSSLLERQMGELRGQTNRRISEIFAPEWYDKYTSFLLRRFKEGVIGLPGVNTATLSENDWWALGRHHGLVTPLLDWTFSPYIAAFFAFMEYACLENPWLRESYSISRLTHEGQGVVCVWELVLEESLFCEGEFELIIDRGQHAHQQRAQGGQFTRLRHDVHLDIASYLEAREKGIYLARYDIPGQEVKKALRDLYLMNIRPSTLFVDMRGAAWEANIAPVFSIGAHVGAF